MREKTAMLAMIALVGAGLAQTVHAEGPFNLDGMTLKTVQEAPAQVAAPRGKPVSDDEYAKFSQMVKGALGNYESCLDKYGNYKLPCVRDEYEALQRRVNEVVDSLTYFFGYQNARSEAQFGPVSWYKRTQDVLSELQPCSTDYFTMDGRPGYYMWHAGCVKKHIGEVLETLKE